MRAVKLLAAVGAAMVVMGQAAPPAPAGGGAGTAPAAVRLWRLDCARQGKNVVQDLNRFSDTRAYTGQSRELTASCYLIAHGATYMLWDSGYPQAAPGSSDTPLNATIVAQLQRIGVSPAQVSMVGVSHYHGDHIGQARDFPAATLMIGKGDYDALSATPPLNGANPAPLAHWIGGPGTRDVVSGDKDVFGDGSVVMLTMPGHTPGHHSLLVTLAKTGPVLISGDVAHFRENLASDGVPTFNTDRADSLASMDRYRALAKNMNAIVVIQHDPRDIGKLPIFPQAAE
jgi:N-acyl homoserine lactone hydrolase